MIRWLACVGLSVAAWGAVGCADPIRAGRVGVLELSPEQVDFRVEDVAPGASVTTEVLMHNSGTGPLTIALAGFDATTPALASGKLAAAVDDTLPARLAPGETRSLAITYTRLDDAPASTALAFEITGALEQRARLPVTISEGAPRLVALPGSLTFASDDAPMQTVQLVNVGSHAVLLHTLAVEGAGFAVEFADQTIAAGPTAESLVFEPSFELAPGASRAVHVTFVATEQRNYEATLRVTNDGPELRVPLHGHAEGPCFVVHPPKVEFGTKGPGNVSEIPVELASCADAPLTLTSIAIGDDVAMGPSSERFSIVFGEDAPSVAKPWVLAPNEHRVIKARFTGPLAEELEAAGFAEDVGAITIRTDARLPLRIVPLHAWTGLNVACELPNARAPVAIDPGCVGVRQAGTLAPKVQWQKSTFTTAPDFDQVMMTPVVGNLNDDNGDGVIDADDIPDVVFTRFQFHLYAAGAVLTAISGADGHELWSIDNLHGVRPFGIGGVALGDLDANGLPEICVQLVGDGLGCLEVVAPGAPGADVRPRVRWTTGALLDAPWPVLGVYPAIADIDGDGYSEVVYLGRVYSHDGTLLAHGIADRASITTFAANLDGTLPLEIVDGGLVYDMPTSGTELVVKADAKLYHGFSAVGDFDGDGLPEVVVVQWETRAMAMFDPSNGAVRWQVTLPPETESNGGGPPTIADLDGDHQLDIGVAGANIYAAYDAHGTMMWSQPMVDDSSRQTGSTVFDFDGDGAAEIVYADEDALHIMDGATGDARFVVTEHASGTGVEYPVVVDVDHDDRAEIVLASNNYYKEGWTGITVLESNDDSWMSARPVWNQHAYQAGTIDDALLPVPLAEQPTGAPFRAGLPGWAERAQTDLQALGVAYCPAECANGSFASATVQVRLGNGGTIAAGRRLELQNAQGVVLAAKDIAPVAPGEDALVTLELTRAAWADAVVTAVLRGDTAITDCHADNERVLVGAWPWAAGADRCMTP